MSLPSHVINDADYLIVAIHRFTLKNLLKVGASASQLFLFYLETSQRQKESLALSGNVPVRATDAYCMKGLGWGRDRFYSAKSELEASGLIKKVTRKNDKNQITGHYVHLVFQNVSHSTGNQDSGNEGDTPLETVEQNDTVSTSLLQSTRNPECGVSQSVGNQDTNTSNININTKEININTGKNFGSVNKKSQFEAEAMEVLTHYNQVYGKTRKAVTALLSPIKGSSSGLFEHWRKTYSVEEIKKAITNSKRDEFWRKVLPQKGPAVLFRMFLPKGDPCDYIGDLLNMPDQKTWAQKVKEEYPEYEIF